MLKEAVDYSIKIEKLLRAKGATGSGLKELRESVPFPLPNDVVDKLKYIGSIRNKMVHDGYECSHEEFNKYKNFSDDVVSYLDDHMYGYAEELFRVDGWWTEYEGTPEYAEYSSLSKKLNEAVVHDIHNFTEDGPIELTAYLSQTFDLDGFIESVNLLSVKCNSPLKEHVLALLTREEKLFPDYRMKKKQAENEKREREEKQAEFECLGKDLKELVESTGADKTYKRMANVFNVITSAGLLYLDITRKK